MEQVRLHIGSISKNLASDIDDFQNRLAKFGTIVSKLELNKKPALDTYFGFITLNITPKNLQQLRSVYNGVNFKGSRISVGIAHTDYKTKWEQDQQRPDPPPTRHELKRKYSAPPREIDVINGTLRGPRKDIYNATYRMIKKGKLKIVTCRKQRLWGFEKKPTDLLVASYSNGRWLDGHGSTVETTDFSKLSETRNEEDHDTAMKVFENMFGNGNDSGPMPMVFSDDDDDGNVDESKPHGDRGQNQSEDRVVSFGDEEDRSEAQPEEDDHSENSEHGEEDNVHQEDNQDDRGVDGHVNDLNQLKGLFGGEEDGGLFGSMADDIDETMTFEEPSLDVIRENSKKKQMYHSTESDIPQVRTPRGLFFAHRDSAFLAAQSQFSKLSAVAAEAPLDLDQWQKEFWEKRGEWNRESRRRRRDVVRQLKKKNMAKGRLTG